jgi:hypothetical protein
VRDPAGEEIRAHVHDANCELQIGDVSRASSKIKEELPGRGTEVKKDVEKWGAEAGAKFDSAVRIALMSSLDHELQRILYSFYTILSPIYTI